MQKITREEARAISVIAQGLDNRVNKKATKDQVAEMVRQLGCLQIDTISVVARSHYLVLWSRLGQYEQRWLDELHHPDHQIFEYWGHAASFIPIELYPYLRRRMIQIADRYATWVRENDGLLNDVVDAVRRNGPLHSGHFERPNRDQPVKAWSWYGGKPTNEALDLLWLTGQLAIERRVNFQRHYDLSERVFPDLHLPELPDEDEERRVLATSAVQAMGITLPGWLNDYYRTRWGVRGHPSPKPVEILEDLALRQIVFPVEIEDVGQAYVAESNRGIFDEVCAGRRPSRTVFLSPFDSLIWDRARTLQLFDFEYRIECYTPAPKRVYGYFTLPILDRGTLIGRLDPKVDRREKVFYIRALHLEPGVRLDKSRAKRVLRTVQEFAKFHEATVSIIEAGPPELLGRYEV
ncbi:MAG TPA: crosslink repair DNA glycosylase YcaQ family protein [Nitrolancea sp.]|nr:crosslink repair DNA glycosylase YcaQ family protein [Nitrolancea sp.]